MTYSAVMADLLALSSHIIDNNDTDIHQNRVINELSEIRNNLASVESCGHSVVLDTGDGVVALDTATGSNGCAVVEQIAAWRSAPVTHLMYTHGTDFWGSIVPIRLLHLVGFGTVSPRFRPLNPRCKPTSMLQGHLIRHGPNFTQQIWRGHSQISLPRML